MDLKTPFDWRAFALFIALVGLALIGARVCYGLFPVESGESLPGNLSWIEAAQAKEENVLWVDAREPAEFQKEHIPGAINVTLKNFDAEFPLFTSQWRPGRMVVVYCDGGGCQLSAEVTGRLKESVPTAQIKVLKGGYPAWLKK